MARVGGLCVANASIGWQRCFAIKKKCVNCQDIIQNSVSKAKKLAVKLEKKKSK